MGQERIEFDVLTPEISRKICIEDCQAKCCDFSLSKHTPHIGLFDYYLLQSNNLQNFITFFKGYGNPQLQQTPEGKCVFLDTESSQCLIYPIRPQGCRKYPYTLKRSKVPSWCELYLSSSEKLLGARKKYNIHIDELFADEKVPEPVILEYFDKLNSHHSFLDLEVIDVTSYREDHSFWSITRYQEYEVALIEEEMKSILGRYTSLPWYVISILHFSEDFELIYQLQGTWKNDTETEISLIDHYPPEIDEFYTLLSLVESTEELQKYLIAGVDLPISSLKTLDFKNGIH
jgi:Fe-S-cluster containining protein